MASYNVSVTQSIETQPDNVAKGGTMEYIISNPLGVDSYFTLETVPNANGAYDSSSPKNTSGSYTLGSGLRELIQNDYFASVIVSPGGGTLTLVPAVDVTGSTLRLNGVGYTDVTIQPAIDWDASALLYVTSLQVSASVTLSSTEQNAVNNLFKRMKGLDPLYSNFGNAGIYNATKGLYPYVGSSLAAYRFNAIFPTAVTQATDATGYPTSPGYQYIGGGITVDGVYGPKGNGVNGVILTNMNWMTGQSSTLSPTDLVMGAVYKTTGTRKDFGEYNPGPGFAGIWLRTGPTVMAREGCLEGSNITGTNQVINGLGHYLLWRSGSDKRVYYQQVQQTYSPGADRSGEGNSTYSGLNTWTWLGLNFSYFNNGGAQSSEAVYAGRCVNYASDTLMFSYVMTSFSSTLISAWNQIVEDFCTETGKKTW